MAVITDITQLSQTAALKGPDGTVDPPSTLDDQCRYLGAFIAMLRDNRGFTIPFVSPGAIMMHGAPNPPNGWLNCAGGAYSRATYAALFQAIGTTWGAGDGSTTFNVPDFRGLFPRGFDAGRGQDSGRAFGTFQAHGFGSHAHGVNDPTHAHSIADPGHVHSAWTDAQGNHNHGLHDPGHSHRRGEYGGTNAVRTEPWSNGYFRLNNDPNPSYTDGSGTGIWLDDAGNHGHNVGIGGAGTGIGIYGSGTGISIQAAGIAETRPSNLACLFIIKV
jgi:microcystin-dependent protein